MQSIIICQLRVIGASQQMPLAGSNNLILVSGENFYLFPHTLN
jgi:hypothetical protein